MSNIGHSQPNAGFEPAATSLKGWRSTKLS